jgi:hypothetical protein
MEGIDLSDSAKADRETNETLDEAGAKESSQNDADTNYLSRVEDCRRESLDRDDPGEAVIGALKAGLAKVLHYVAKKAERGLEAEATTLAEVPQLESTMNNYKALTRQYDRFANLEVRLSELRSQEQILHSTRATDPLRARDTRPR